MLDYRYSLKWLGVCMYADVGILTKYVWLYNPSSKTSRMLKFKPIFNIQMKKPMFFSSLREIESLKNAQVLPVTTIVR